MGGFHWKGIFYRNLASVVGVCWHPYPETANQGKGQLPEPVPNDFLIGSLYKLSPILNLCNPESLQTWPRWRQCVWHGLRNELLGGA